MSDALGVALNLNDPMVSLFIEAVILPHLTRARRQSSELTDFPGIRI